MRCGMGKPDFDRMIKLGEWLEKFLNPDIKIWDFRKLFQDSLQIIKADYPVDLSKTWMGEIEKINCSDGLNKIDYPFIKKTFKGYKDDWDKISEELELSKKESNQEEITRIKKEEIRCFFKYDILNMMKMREDLNFLLKKINDSGIPWEILLADLAQEEEKAFDENKPTKKVIGRFMAGYSSLAEVFIRRDNKFIKTRTFNDGGYYQNFGEIYEGFYDFDTTCVISNIFLDFLVLGGQDYFLFCNNCGRFTAIKRKGRKKYCSDVCRTAAQRK